MFGVGESDGAGLLKKLENPQNMVATIINKQSSGKGRAQTSNNKQDSDSKPVRMLTREEEAKFRLLAVRFCDESVTIKGGAIVFINFRPNEVGAEVSTRITPVGTIREVQEATLREMLHLTGCSLQSK